MVQQPIISQAYIGCQHQTYRCCINKSMAMVSSGNLTGVYGMLKSTGLPQNNDRDMDGKHVEMYLVSD